MKTKVRAKAKVSLNQNLQQAKSSKNDEFYTQLVDIENELSHYKEHFKGKVIFCNCDDPVESNFWKYFSLNFEFFGLKKLISTHYEVAKPSYKLEMTKGKVIKTPLKGNGDFRSAECIEILKEVDIVVTNPPFSLFKEYVAQLVECDKKFIIIGSQNALTYKGIFKLIKNKIGWGYTYPKSFLQPNGFIKTFGNICWYTNLEISKRHEDLFLFRTYNSKDYPKYDNYDAINVDKTKDIPVDWKGVMGVPITFMNKYNPEQFEIIGSTDRGGDNFISVANIRLTEKKEDSAKINGKKMYKRLFIKNRPKSFDMFQDPRRCNA